MNEYWLNEYWLNESDMHIGKTCIQRMWHYPNEEEGYLISSKQYEWILIKSIDPIFSKFDEPDRMNEVREGRSHYQFIIIH